ncbi:MAG: Spy/CpxP family protein refolding chaperone [Candidatus Saganbacteria bacterium]|nr:Spy/CpxP family protein refolding chaperone [Candidatus Saganbacteria bacterium]
MMGKIGWGRMIVVALVLAMFSSQACAAWGRGGRPGKIDHERAMAGIAKKLDLTREQADKFKAGEQAQKKVVVAGRRKIKELGDKLKDELAKDSPDRDKTRDLIRRIGAQMTELRIARTDSLLQLKALLTPAQKEKFKALLDKKGGRIPLGLGGNRH